MIKKESIKQLNYLDFVQKEREQIKRTQMMLTISCLKEGDYAGLVRGTDYEKKAEGSQKKLVSTIRAQIRSYKTHNKSNA